MKTFFHFNPSTFAATALLVSAISASAVMPNFNLANDWSDTSNPNSTWSYNLNNSPIATYTTMWWGPGAWCPTGDLGDGSILRGPVPVGLDPFGNNCVPFDWQAGDVVMHALSIPYGGGSTFLNATWTAPFNGTIDIAGRAWDSEMFADRDVAWALLVNGTTIAQRGSTFGLYRTDAAADFANNLLSGYSLNNISVAQGDTIEFRVITDTFYGHFVGVQENIQYTYVPEPGTASLLALGAVGMGLWRRRKL